MDLLGADLLYCEKCSNRAPFQHVLDLDRLGISILHYQADIVNQVPAVEGESILTSKGTSNVFIIINANNNKFSSEDIMPEFDINKVTCPRCRFRAKNAQKLLQSEINVEKRDIRGICGHCKSKQSLQKSCPICEEIVKKFLDMAGARERTLKIWVKQKEAHLHRPLSARAEEKYLGKETSKSKDIELKLIMEPKMEFFQPVHIPPLVERKKIIYMPKDTPKISEFPSDESVVTSFVTIFSQTDKMPKQGFKYIFPDDKKKERAGKDTEKEGGEEPPQKQGIHEKDKLKKNQVEDIITRKQLKEKISVSISTDFKGPIVKDEEKVGKTTEKVGKEKESGEETPQKQGIQEKDKLKKGQVGDIITRKQLKEKISTSISTDSKGPIVKDKEKVGKVKEGREQIPQKQGIQEKDKLKKDQVGDTISRKQLKEKFSTSISTDSKGPMVKDKEKVGKEKERAGKGTEKVGKEKERAGKETEKEGKEKGRANKGTEKVGIEKERAGKEKERTGKETGKVGKEKERVGKETEKVGKEKERAGKEIGIVGKEKKGKLEKDRVGEITEKTERGKERLEYTKEKTSAKRKGEMQLEASFAKGEKPKPGENVKKDEGMPLSKDQKAKRNKLQPPPKDDKASKAPSEPPSAADMGKKRKPLSMPLPPPSPDRKTKKGDDVEAKSSSKGAKKGAESGMKEPSKDTKKHKEKPRKSKDEKYKDTGKSKKEWDLKEKEMEARRLQRQPEGQVKDKLDKGRDRKVDQKKDVTEDKGAKVKSGKDLSSGKDAKKEEKTTTESKLIPRRSVQNVKSQDTDTDLDPKAVARENEIKLKHLQEKALLGARSTVLRRVPLPEIPTGDYSLFKVAVKVKPDVHKVVKIKRKLLSVIGMKSLKMRGPSYGNLVLKMIKLGKEAKYKKYKPISKRGYKVRSARFGRFSIGSLSINSDIELDIESFINVFNKTERVRDKIKDTRIVRNVPEKEVKTQIEPKIFHRVLGADEPLLFDLEEEKVEPDITCKGIIRYKLSDRTFIEKGWTKLPTEKVVRKMNIYKIRPAHPEFDWFYNNKKKGFMTYESGEKLAEFDENGCGRWYYKNGKIALDYYDSEDIHGQQRFVIYGSGEMDERCRVTPVAVLAMFDYLGNGIVFDHHGKIRVKYNQTEGAILDRTIGPTSRWKWHTLNDPPILKQVMIDTYAEDLDPGIIALGGPEDTKQRPEDLDRLTIELENFAKEQTKKTKQKYQPFQIRMKVLKINKQLSLKILDQAHIYLYFRDGSTNIKLNLGMILDHQEIIDTDTADVAEVSNSLDRYPPRTDSLMELQNNLKRTRYYDRQCVGRTMRIDPPVPISSAEKLVCALSKPLLRPPLSVPCLCPQGNVANCHRKPSQTNLYYNTRFI